jgi:luciferase family oxidoreductase group 1
MTLRLPVSIHDRSHLTAGADSREALRRTIDRAKHAERHGYHRLWVAEHHGVPGVAGSAPAVLLAAIGNATSSIRIGSGGVMVPNHQPVVIAEQFATLDALFPGRIDLGLGRSLGFVSAVRRALRRETYSIEEFADDIAEIVSLLNGDSSMTLMPETNGIPLFVLATGKGAEVAARAGLPLVAGGPKILTRDADGRTAIDRYRDMFRPSRFATDPCLILNVTALASESNAGDLALPEAWAHVNSKIQGAFLPLESPATIKAMSLPDRQRDRLTRIATSTITGTAFEVVARIEELVSQTGADEVMLSGSFFDHDSALHSDALLAGALGLAS